MIAAASMATTPCPPWCRTNHDRFRNHGQIVHDVDGIVVYAYQYDDQASNVSVVIGHADTVEIAPELASTFATVLSGLGHPEIAAAVREAAAIISGAVGGRR